MALGVKGLLPPLVQLERLVEQVTSLSLFLYFSIYLSQIQVLTKSGY